MYTPDEARLLWRMTRRNNRRLKRRQRRESALSDVNQECVTAASQGGAVAIYPRDCYVENSLFHLRAGERRHLQKMLKGKGWDLAYNEVPWWKWGKTHFELRAINGD